MWPVWRGGVAGALAVVCGAARPVPKGVALPPGMHHRSVSSSMLEREGGPARGAYSGCGLRALDAPQEQPGSATSLLSLLTFCGQRKLMHGPDPHHCQRGASDDLDPQTKPSREEQLQNAEWWGWLLGEGKSWGAVGALSGQLRADVAPCAKAPLPSQCTSHPACRSSWGPAPCTGWGIKQTVPAPCLRTTPLPTYLHLLQHCSCVPFSSPLPSVPTREVRLQRLP